MRLEQLYRIRFTYPESWVVGLEGGWEQHLMIAEGRCEGRISGRFRGVNFPQRRTATGPCRPDFRAVIETDDRATLMFRMGASTSTNADGSMPSRRADSRTNLLKGSVPKRHAQAVET